MPAYTRKTIDQPVQGSSSEVYWQTAHVSRQQRAQKHQHRSCVIWFTGLSGSGKSTLAHALELRLHQMQCSTFVLDGDNVRHGLCADLAFSADERTENIRRIGEVSKLFLEAGVITLTAFISPYEEDRKAARALFDSADFIEIYCQCALEECEKRDVKGLYKKARQGLIKEFTGISAPYEVPQTPEMVCNTQTNSVESCIDQILLLLRKRGVFLDMKTL
ncbi:adenylyl-sulfate kinase [Neptunomonas sp.]|uniref:adenylyl-sulfate kinase n=1 Tax=Neptunomonas sp. TaxID=1971898 RepID=UPI0025D12C94|nr:adenylyl-sulfate kinase [Neptunomonas sp.]